MINLTQRELSNEDLQAKAPSIFALEPWQKMSDKYRFIPTIEVIDALRDAKFYPVRAQQSNSRIPGKANYTRHMLRFRLRGQDAPQALGDVIPEIVLTNSHDGTAAYNLMLGLFRLACLNGMVAAMGELAQIRARHTGAISLPEQIIRGSLSLFDQAPKVLNRVQEFQQIMLNDQEQRAYAEAALPLLGSTIEISPEAILQPRRRADQNTGAWNGGPAAYSRPAPDLWRTFNVVQENMLKGGARGRSESGRRMHTRAIVAVDRDVKLNKALWSLTEKMAELKTSLNGNVAPLIQS
jgi:hypothetical protein